MVILQEGLNRIRDLHSIDTTECWMGTSGSAVVESQTGLQSGVSVSKQTITITAADKVNTFEYILPSTAGTSTIYRESGLIGGTAGTADCNRNTFTGEEHTENDDIIIKQTIFYRNP